MRLSLVHLHALADPYFLTVKQEVSCRFMTIKREEKGRLSGLWRTTRCSGSWRLRTPNPSPICFSCIIVYSMQPPTTPPTSSRVGLTGGFLCLREGAVPTAILIDGAYFIKRFRSIEPHNSMDPQRAADVAHRWTVAHLTTANKPKRELYRIFFYDCAPLEKKMHYPVTKRAVDFAKSPEAVFRRKLHDLLRRKRKVALRDGLINAAGK